ncbi:MAG TPA: ABC transporter ATP-binding protein [Gemmatimonadales bacterium]|nr:ABC transporter ATP-binding protein [Gemmatimonadales bacterium]
MTAATAVAPAVEFRALRKRFGRLAALDGVDIQVAPGRVTALVGPNGAGKSTLIKCLLGLVRPDEGSILLGGNPLGAGWAYRRELGYMPQAPRFPDNLTGREVVAMLRDLRGRGGDHDEELLDWFGESGALDRPVRVLSGGTRQKLNAAIAFLFRPVLLILDEPTAGLDPVASGILKDKIRRVRDAGATVVLSSHLMAELEELAEDLVFLVEGRVRYAGPLSGLKERTGEAGLERAMAALLKRGGA